MAVTTAVVLAFAFPSSSSARRVDPVIHAKQVARHLLAHRGWSGQFWALDGIIVRESHWHTWARNPGSGACGIPQALPCSKMASMDSDYRTNPWTQLRWMLRYIEKRYGSPTNAYRFRVSHGWY